MVVTVVDFVIVLCSDRQDGRVRGRQRFSRRIRRRCGGFHAVRGFGPSGHDGLWLVILFLIVIGFNALHFLPLAH